MVDFAPTMLLAKLRLCMLPFNPNDTRRREWGKAPRDTITGKRAEKYIEVSLAGRFVLITPGDAVK